ncbi:hypothetical protein [Campylobacter aviculae]|uniref:Uncharacterized protein n=1 Tax=Campylobacter aviculae TaxID=2510190 RepID=A0A4U7BRH6_9BACT|nr:hypothetical protein [Campylobacter aviculae]TKX32960.1 hypothetical protein CQA76_01375 [Campylobacter aviculae]
MAFMNLNKIFRVKYDFNLFKIEKKSDIKNIILKDYILKAYKDEFNPNGETFVYQGIKDQIFKENDEILILNISEKIIFFKNLTQNSDNFSEIQMKQSLLLSFLFFVSLFFISLFIMEFSIIDLFFLAICIIILITSSISTNLLFKHISLLKKFSKEEMKEFLKKRKNVKA